MDDDVRVPGLLQCTFKCLDQVMGQLPDKSYRIGQQDLLLSFQLQDPGGGVQRGKQHRILQDPRVCQGIFHTALPRRGIAYQCRHLHVGALPLGADQFPVLFHFLQLPFQTADPLPDQAPVHLQLFLSRASRPDPAAQTGKGVAQSGEPCRPVTELCQLYLDLAFSGNRMRGKDIQDQQCPVNDLALQLLLQVIELHRGKLVVADDAGCLLLPDQVFQLFYFSFSNIGLGMHGLPVLDQPSRNRGTCGPGKCLQFVQGFLRKLIVTQLDPHQDEAFFLLFQII